jgi:hypothetical protein
MRISQSPATSRRIIVTRNEQAGGSSPLLGSLFYLQNHEKLKAPAGASGAMGIGSGWANLLRVSPEIGLDICSSFEVPPRLHPTGRSSPTPAIALIVRNSRLVVFLRRTTLPFRRGPWLRACILALRVTIERNDRLVGARRVHYGGIRLLRGKESTT